MLFEEIKNIKSEKRDIRNFGFTFGVICGVLSGMLWWKGKDTYTVFLALSLAFIFLGLFLPSVLRPLQKGWMVFAVLLGWVMTRLILSVLFYVVFTFIGLVSRLFGKEFLDLKPGESRGTYWIEKEKKPFDRKNYERQF